MHSLYNIIVLGIMLICTLLAYVQTSKLDVNHHKISHLDDILLLIAIPAFFANLIFTSVAAIAENEYLILSENIISLVQVVIQTPWIIDGLRRCSNSYANLKHKPGKFHL